MLRHWKDIFFLIALLRDGFQFKTPTSDSIFLKNLLHLPKNEKRQSEREKKKEGNELTFIFIVSCDGDNGVLDVLILVDFGFIQGLLEVRWIIVLVADADTDVLGHYKEKKTNNKIKNQALNKSE